MPLNLPLVLLLVGMNLLFFAAGHFVGGRHEAKRGVVLASRYVQDNRTSRTVFVPGSDEPYVLPPGGTVEVRWFPKRPTDVNLVTRHPLMAGERFAED